VPCSHLSPLLPPFHHNTHSEDARFVWKRLPPASQASRPARAAFRVLQAVWARDLEGTASAAASLPEAVSTEGAAAAGLVAPLRAALRARAAALIARAYTRLPLSRLAALLGCADEREAAAAAAEFGWSQAEGGVVSGLRAPTPGAAALAAGARPGVAGAAAPSADLLDAFVDYVVELEA